jgi:ferredoxin/flavodoxin---NADP+ reductase
MNDFIIIGAGPVGLYGAYLAGLRGLKGCILESLPIVGGQLMALYPEKTIYDLPGFVGIQASTFIHQLYAQYERFEQSIPIHLSSAVQHIQRRKDDTYHVTTVDGTSYASRFVILTSGIGQMTPKKLDDRFVAHPSIHYQLEKRDSYGDQDIVILGGGNTALDYANTLINVARSVTLVHRRHVFKAFEHSLEMFKKAGGHVLVPYELDAYTPLEGSRLELTLIHTQTQEKIKRGAHHVFVCYGYGTNLSTSYHPDLTLASKKHAFDQNKIVVNARYETSLQNVFAAGDAITYEGKANHLSQGFGEMTTIMEILHHTLYPTIKIPHSSFMALNSNKEGPSS